MEAGTLERPLAAVPPQDADPGDETDADPEASAEKPTPPMQIPIPGTEQRITDVAGGSQPTSTEVRLLGGSLPVEGQFQGEETVTLLVEAKVGSVEVVYTTDDWGETKAVKRRHKLRMTSVRRA